MLNYMRSLAAGLLFLFSATGANSAVYGPQQQLPAAAVQAFKENPSQILQEFTVPDALTIRVRDLGATDPTTVPMLIGLLKTAEQKTQMPAIAAGLAQLARLAATAGDQAFATEIAVAVAQSGNADAVLAYQVAAGDTRILATGGGGGGSGGGGPTGSNGIVFGSSNNGASTFGGLHYTTPGAGSGATGFSGATADNAATTTGSTASVSLQ